jgi:hypothetical protein
MGPNHKSTRHKGRPVGPTPWPTDHTLSQFRPRLVNYAPKSVHKSIPGPKVSGDWKEWPANHVDGRSTVHHLQINVGVFACILSTDGETFGFTRGRGVQV